MNSRLFEAFEARAQQIKDYMAGNEQKYVAFSEPKQSHADAIDMGQHQAQQLRQQQQQLQQQQQQMASFQQDPYGSLMGGGSGAGTAASRHSGSTWGTMIGKIIMIQTAAL